MQASINCTKLANGDLLVTAGNDGRAEIKAMQGAQRDYWSILAELFEPYFTNGSFEPFDAGDGNPFVGLTSAPCIAESMSHLDDGTNRVDGEFWYFDRYATHDLLDELRNRGRTVFTLAREH